MYVNHPFLFVISDVTIRHQLVFKRHQFSYSYSIDCRESIIALLDQTWPWHLIMVRTWCFTCSHKTAIKSATTKRNQHDTSLSMTAPTSMAFQWMSHVSVSFSCWVLTLQNHLYNNIKHSRVLMVWLSTNPVLLCHHPLVERCQLSSPCEWSCCYGDSLMPESTSRVSDQWTIKASVPICQATAYDCCDIIQN